jgi:hypothetical protein
VGTGYPRIVHCVVSRGRRALERWDLDGPYDVVTKGCHTWSVRGRVYDMLVRFIALQDCLLIWISTLLSDMSDSLFTAITSRNVCFMG